MSNVEQQQNLTRGNESKAPRCTSPYLSRDIVLGSTSIDVPDRHFVHVTGSVIIHEADDNDMISAVLNSDVTRE